MGHVVLCLLTLSSDSRIGVRFPSSFFLLPFFFLPSSFLVLVQGFCVLFHCQIADRNMEAFPASAMSDEWQGHSWNRGHRLAGRINSGMTAHGAGTSR